MWSIYPVINKTEHLYSVIQGEDITLDNIQGEVEGPTAGRNIRV